MLILHSLVYTFMCEKFNTIMTNRFTIKLLISLCWLLIALFQINCSKQQDKTETKEEIIKRGAYLVNFGGCNECHTPKIFTELGPIPDTTRLLSGFRQDTPLPRIDTSMIGLGKWYLTTNDLMAWVGPWGISFSANLTPDEKTGLGSWNEQMFINSMKNGLHLGAGRALLPPMPFVGLAGLKDDDLKSIFAYLKSIKPISNKVPSPIVPEDIPKKFGR